MMRKIGLTGGIASGKTTVAAWFKNKGVAVFDADRTVHQLLNGPAVMAALAKEFGPEYIAGGKVNRALLGSKVFQDQKMKVKLEKLLHPLVKAEMEKACREAEQRGEKLIILDIPLLFETGWDKYADETWVVYVPFAVQLARLIGRNDLNKENALNRIHAQMPLAAKARQADRVIDNSGSWSETENRLAALWEDINRQLGNAGKFQE